MNAAELRIHNIVGCKVSNDAGVYQVAGIDGWVKVYKTKQDYENEQYNSKIDLDSNKKYKPVNYNNEMLIRLSGGARQGETYPESKIKGIKLTEEWLIKFGFEKNHIIGESSFIKDGMIVELLLNSWIARLRYDSETSIKIIKIEYVHQLQNLYFTLTGTELTIHP